MVEGILGLNNVGWAHSGLKMRDLQHDNFEILAASPLIYVGFKGTRV